MSEQRPSNMERKRQRTRVKAVGLAEAMTQPSSECTCYVHPVLRPPLNIKDYAIGYGPCHAISQEKYDEVVKALRERSEENCIRLTAFGGKHVGPWATCDKEPCVTDRALTEEGR